ncbi:hypothetical protein GX586_06320 [bacterium]|nr:hypothetical protein [bacterium]
MPGKTSFAHYFQIGLFVLITLSLMCLTTLFIGFDKFFRSTELYYTYFRKIPRGLSRSCQVYLEGLEAGRVKYMRRVIGTNGTPWIEVAMAVNEDEPVGTNMMVRIEAPLIGGPACLQIYTPGSNDVAEAVDIVMDHTFYIPAKQLTRIEALEEKVQTLLGNLNSVDMQAFNQGMKTMSDELTQTLQAVNCYLSDRRIDELLTSLNYLAGEGSIFVSNVSRRLSGPTLDETIASLRVTTSNLMVITSRIDDALPEERLRRVVRNTDRIIATGAPTLEDLQGLMGELRSVASSLNAVIDAVDRNPSSLLFSEPVPKPDRPGETP